MRAARVAHYKSGEVSVCIDGQVTSITPPWQLSDSCSELQRIVSENSLQFLSSMEAEAAMLDWYNALGIEGELEIIVPDLDYYLQLWQQSVWDEKNLRDVDSEARLAFAGLFGAQGDANPRSDKYSGLYHDCHKSGYNKARLNFLMQRAGFVRVVVKQEKGSLIASGVKTMHKGERQVSPSLLNIRPDHTQRYQFAIEYLGNENVSKVLDLACGIGYGSAMIADAVKKVDVTGVDVDKYAVEYAKEYYQRDGLDFVCQDALALPFEPQSFDAIVSFETIEHVPFERALMEVFHGLLKSGGKLIFSTPNEAVMPFDPQRFKYHVKHYTRQEIIQLLTDSGFVLESIYTQIDRVNSMPVKGENGQYLIIVAVRD